MKKNHLLKERARTARKMPNTAEEILWWALRDRRPGGFKFRRQHVKGSYILDFYCAEACLAVELDGETHVGREKQDLVRQKWLEAQGLMVLRIQNPDVFEKKDGVLDTIWYWCDQRTCKPARPSP